MSKLSLWKTISLLCLFCAVGAIGSPAQTLTTLHSFDFTDGADLLAGLVQGTDGNLYGTTSGGEISNPACPGTTNDTCGTVFRMTPGGTLTTLYKFCSQTNCADGQYPWAGLVLATNGNFYGTTVYGGAYGYGTVFEITPSGTLTSLHSFDYTDGAYPYAGLIQATDGNFYGTTEGGGPNNGYGCDGNLCGTVFKITPEGTLTTLYSFCSQTGCTDGGNPYGTLVQATDGNFYGTTWDGAGSCYGGCGTVFKITTGGELTTLHIFGYSDGERPYAALVQASDGNFYGTTYQGGANGIGTVFRVTPGGTLTTLYSFAGYPTDGAFPVAGLVQATDGNFYGTTEEGGTAVNSNVGTVFEITAGGAETLLYSFPEPDTVAGANPYGGLVQATNGTFYGTTAYGGAYGGGTAFSLSVGLGPFVETLPTSGGVGAAVIILGNNLTGATSVSFNGTTATFTVVSDTEIETTVPSGATSGTVQVTTTNGALNSNVPFQVTAQQALPSANVAPTGLTFVAQNVGTTSVPQPVILSNTGNAPLTIANIVVSGNFGETNNCRGSVVPSSPCTINVIFSPTAMGTFTGTVTITDNSNGVAASMQTVTLTGTGINPAASLSATSEGFGSQVINTASAVKKVTLTSTGTTNLNISAIAINGTNAGDFSQTNNCPASMAPAAKCTISLTYTPTVLGAEMASLAVADNAANSPQSITLSGSGESSVVLSPTSLSFGNVGENSPSASKSITLTNHQAVALTISGITMSSPDYTETDTCNGSVAAKGTCTISVTLTPTTQGADDGTVSVNDNAANAPQTATLTGTGIVPAKLSATSLAFGNVPQSTASTSKNITLTNSEAVALTISSITTGNPDFTETNTCDGSVPAKGNCVITVTFTPSIVGAETGTLTVTDAASDSPQVASLTGTGIVQTKVSPASLTFAALKVGTTSAAKNVTLTNNLSTSLTISAITFTGTNPGDFTAPTNTCDGSLAAKSTCTISVTFTPGAIGARTATMNVNDSANNTPQTVALTGTGK